MKSECLFKYIGRYSNPVIVDALTYTPTKARCLIACKDTCSGDHATRPIYNTKKATVQRPFDRLIPLGPPDQPCTPLGAERRPKRGLNSETNRKKRQTVSLQEKFPLQ
jgi:hypothetical protein